MAQWARALAAETQRPEFKSPAFICNILYGYVPVNPALWGGVETGSMGLVAASPALSLVREKGIRQKVTNQNI